ncbi:MAG: hypothetical protein II943_06875 [Victivallales bacterium]|nr:hypothetical protein [Victivallales bacterium]
MAWTGIAPAPATWQGVWHGLALRLYPPPGKGRGMDWHCACSRHLARDATWTGIAPAPATWQGTRHGLALRLLPPLGKGRGMRQVARTGRQFFRRKSVGQQ